MLIVFRTRCAACGREPGLRIEVQGARADHPCADDPAPASVETLLVAGSTISGGVAFYMMSVFGLSYGTA
ncbi:hypothetical protein HBB16_00980 [Pseudonocardia sp. MCCB 268]|nr:hypothetical protein [Pseudonocardia cytotoxica]